MFDDHESLMVPRIMTGRKVRVGMTFYLLRPSQVALVVKDPHANAGDIRDSGSIPGSGRSPGGGNDNPLQYSCLENPTDRRAWRATVHRVTKSWTQISDSFTFFQETRKH